MPPRGRKQKQQGEREQGWDLSSCRRADLPEYNALYDPNMRHYFENGNIQKLLYRTGQIDRNGRVIDLKKNKGKLHIIEQEFKQAERLEKWRQREEEEMRYRVQQKRHGALERARQQEKLMKLREDREIRREIVSAARDAYGIKYPAIDRKTWSRTSRSGGLSNSASEQNSFFITDGLSETRQSSS